MSNFIDQLGIPNQADNGPCDNFLVSNGGSYKLGNGYWLFVARHDGRVPDNWGVLDSIGNHTLDLGRWTHKAQALVFIPDTAAQSSRSSESATPKTVEENRRSSSEKQMKPTISDPGYSLSPEANPHRVSQPLEACVLTTPGPGFDVSDGRYLITREAYDVNTDVESAIRATLGEAVTIAEWQNLKSALFTEARLSEFFERVGIPRQTDEACNNLLVSNEGRYRLAIGDWFMLARHDGIVPDNWAVLESIGKHALDLGRSTYKSQVLVFIPAMNQPLASSTSAPSGRLAQEAHKSAELGNAAETIGTTVDPTDRDRLLRETIGRTEEIYNKYNRAKGSAPSESAQQDRLNEKTTENKGRQHSQTQIDRHFDGDEPGAEGAPLSQSNIRTSDVSGENQGLHAQTFYKAIGAIFTGLLLILIVVALISQRKVASDLTTSKRGQTKFKVMKR